MAEKSSIFDKVDESADKAAVANARAEIAANQGVLHGKVRAWLLRLREGAIEPPPGT